MHAAGIAQLVRRLEAAGLASLEVEGPGLSLRLALAPRDDGSARRVLAVTATADGIDDAASGVVAKAPVAGVLRLRHPHAREPFAKLGAEVAAGRVVALLEIGTIFVPVVAQADGVLGRLHAAPDALVGYGAPLFEVFAAPGHA